jgi:hypothetical protein
MTERFESHLLSLPRGTVALDCDGVILDFLSQFRAVANYALGRDVEEGENVYDLNKRFNLQPHERDHIMKIFHHEGFWSNLPALPGAIDGARALQDAGHRVVVVTAIDDDFKSARLDNLRRLGFKPDEIYCVGAHSGHTKGEAFHVEQPHAIVDDRLVYLKEATTMVKQHTPELVWVNDNIPQHGHIPDFVHHEVDGLHHWARPIAERRDVRFAPRSFKP